METTATQLTAAETVAYDHLRRITALDVTGPIPVVCHTSDGASTVGYTDSPAIAAEAVMVLAWRALPDETFTTGATA